MKITSVKSYRKDLALKRPYTIARETISAVENIFFEVTLANGMKGIGAANPDVNVVGESPSQTFQNLQSDFIQQLVGKDIRQFQLHIYNSRNHFEKFPGTQAAIDIALHDAFGQWIGMSVVDFYGRHHQKLQTSVTIGIKNVEETLKDAQEYKESGFHVLKVKTGLDCEVDAERIIKLREKFGEYFTIRVDANEGYGPEQLKIFLHRSKHTDIELIEQPFLPGREEELLQFPKETRRILAADESLKNARAALKLSQQQAFGIFNVKLMKCGGIMGALEIANIAKASDIQLFWGCNDESMVSITAALHVAFACPHTRYLDLDGSFDLTGDIVEKGFTLEDGYLSPGNGPGLGLSFL